MEKALLTGIAVADLIAADLDHVARPGEVVFSEEIKLRTGGHPCNVSLNLKDLGVDPEKLFVAISIGSDILGDFIADSLRKREIPLQPERSDKETSRDLILVEKGKDRRFHPMVGSNLELDTAFVKKVFKAQKPGLFYIGGVGMLGMDDQLDVVLEDAKNMGCVTFIDPVQPYEHDWSYLQRSLSFIDVLHLNVEEGKALTGEDSKKRILNVLLEKGVDLVLLTSGEKGAMGATKAGSVEVPALSPEPFGKVIDPTGAGDAFCAGIIYRLLQQRGYLERCLDSLEELERLVKFASACGALASTVTGATGSLHIDRVRRIARRG